VAKTTYNDIKPWEKEIHQKLFNQCGHSDYLMHVFMEAWQSFKEDGWSYDGATFVREYKNEFWELAAFIHDWLNANGYVGQKVDDFFISIMIELEYPVSIIRERTQWMLFTFLNVFWHKINFNFKSSDIPEHLKRKKHGKY
jgi:hypothetical protein